MVRLLVYGVLICTSFYLSTEDKATSHAAKQPNLPCEIAEAPISDAKDTEEYYLLIKKRVEECRKRTDNFASEESLGELPSTDPTPLAASK